MDTATTTETGTVLALKEWGAAIHALLQGRQSILLRKGGIHEKAFTTPDSPGGIVLFPTVAHTHAERTRPEHRDLLPLGDADADDDRVVIRAGVTIVEAVEVTAPERLPELSDLHLWTDASIQEDRVAFRPTKPLTVLVVRAVALPAPVTLPRTDAHAGCRSWLDLDVLDAPGLLWPEEAQGVLPDDVLQGIAARVRRTVGGLGDARTEEQAS